MTTPAGSNSMDAGRVIAAAIVASAIGALIYNVLPVFLGAAQDYRGLDNRNLGFLTAAFFLGFNIATGSAFFWIRNVSWKTVVGIALPLSCVSLGFPVLAPGHAVLLLCMALAGAALACIYAVGTTIIADSSNPARWFGLKLGAEALLGSALMLLLPLLFVPRWGYGGAVAGIVVTILLLAPFLLWVPRRGNKARAEPSFEAVATPAAQTPLIWAALAAALIFFSGASAIWAFIERIGVQRGFEAAELSTLLSVNLLLTVFGSLVAAGLGGRFGVVRPFAAGGLLSLLGLLLLAQPGSFAIFAIGACIETFVLGLLQPFVVTQVANLDTDGRYVVLSVPAVGIGGMLGPAIAGVITQSGEYTILLVYVAMTVLLAAALLLLSTRGLHSGAR